jgi:hypothetical protein
VVERGPEKAGVGGPIPSLGILIFLFLFHKPALCDRIYYRGFLLTKRMKGG